MDYVGPYESMEDVAQAGAKKARLSVLDMLLRGFLSGALLAFATAIAFKVTEGLSGGAVFLVSAAVFPVGFAMIVVFGLELLTGNFALLPVAIARGRTGYGELARNWTWVFIGNFVGSTFFGALLVFALTEGFTQHGGPLALKLIAVAQSKTLVYQHAGLAGWMTAFVKGILCNWMVAMGTIIAFSSKSTLGKIAAIWLPIFTFFGLGFEHSVVNMFVIPTAMMLGADISMQQWWVWNQIPVTLGNIVGGALLAGLLLNAMFKPATASLASGNGAAARADGSTTPAKVAV